ncbi:hypothetical protein VAE130_550121 [Vibrio aestuarianus]|uniref:Uncharacterized protein n=1 Tax=Vibrio aestuarianus TaxID=28171 RepID=A0ABN8TT84_9VIBR|nr:hypothetical protein VAE032_240120 [Vibrio aestuarianus]CAH8185446.1 hypothetical protein VAE055_340121 [Vibrio aestuarianus]CAH8185584.1 hypothetical protein VAE130_550121 [Vibrio aestuarianus]CAH8185774.1 hypothetical protein VAE115_290123 [Vibrio aestuarianus]CAH8191760.1 hypothetical protein VAE142_870119 [Vibrio aestuarianus]
MTCLLFTQNIKSSDVQSPYLVLGKYSVSLQLRKAINICYIRTIDVNQQSDWN